MATIDFTHLTINIAYKDLGYGLSSLVSVNSADFSNEDLRDVLTPDLVKQLSAAITHGLERLANYDPAKSIGGTFRVPD